jgi:predicted phosphodiesterase
MRIHIASDLHLEYLEKRFPDYRAVERSDADVLVLAGDISAGTRTLDLFSDWPCPIIYVPGNHEFYESSIDDVVAEFESRVADYPNIHVLAPGSAEIAGVRFVGCTLWTDFEVFGIDRRSSAMQECEDKIVDHRVITRKEGQPFSPEAARQLHWEHRAWLKETLSTPFAGKTVAVTHHAPHPNSMDPRFSNELTSAGFVSDLTGLLDMADLFIHGHTHCSSDYVAGGTRIVANPMGYCHGIKVAKTPADLKRENESFDSRFIVEI